MQGAARSHIEHIGKGRNAAAARRASSCRARRTGPVAALRPLAMGRAIAGGLRNHSGRWNRQLKQFPHIVAQDGFAFRLRQVGRVIQWIRPMRHPAGIRPGADHLEARVALEHAPRQHRADDILNIPDDLHETVFDQ